MRFQVSLVLLVLLTPSLGFTQESATAIPRIGFIVSSGDPSNPQLEAFREGLQDLGYVEGKNIAIERRYAQGRVGRMAPFVREFVDKKVDVIVGVNNVVIQAAKEATKTIPIVAVTTIDPVAAGYATTFAQPGGNITGLASLMRDVSAKRIELLKELLPKLSRIGVLWDIDGPGPAVARIAYERAARAFNLELTSLELRGPYHDLTRVFRAAKSARVDALVVVANFATSQVARKIFAMAIQSRLPSMTEDRLYVDAGGLISYGANTVELYRRAATYTDKVLKGARPAELPIEEPKRFELVINHKTARQIGIAIPPSILVRENK